MSIFLSRYDYTLESAFSGDLAKEHAEMLGEDDLSYIGYTYHWVVGGAEKIPVLGLIFALFEATVFISLYRLFDLCWSSLDLCCCCDDKPPAEELPPPPAAPPVPAAAEANWAQASILTVIFDKDVLGIVGEYFIDSKVGMMSNQQIDERIKALAIFNPKSTHMNLSLPYLSEIHKVNLSNMDLKITFTPRQYKICEDTRDLLIAISKQCIRIKTLTIIINFTNVDFRDKRENERYEHAMDSVLHCCSMSRLTYEGEVPPGFVKAFQRYITTNGASNHEGKLFIGATPWKDVAPGFLG